MALDQPFCVVCFCDLPQPGLCPECKKVEEDKRMKISEICDGSTYYLEVESNYKVSEEGKGQKDAVNFFMGVEQVNGLDSLISVSTDDARKFAESIIALCNRIENS